MAGKSFYFVSYRLVDENPDHYSEIIDALEDMPAIPIFDRQWIIHSPLPTAGDLRNALARKWANFDYGRDEMFVTLVKENDCCAFNPKKELANVFAALRKIA